MSLPAMKPDSAPKVRISARTRDAIGHMVNEGLSRADAATKAGITDNWLYSQMRKPEVLSLQRELMQMLRTSEASRTIARAAKLADTAESEHVKLQANTWLAALEGIAPVQRTENIHHLNVQVPGLCIMIAPRMDAPLIHDQSREVGSHSTINDLHHPVPHPSTRNAIETSYREVPEPTPGAPGRRGKS